VSRGKIVSKVNVRIHRYQVVKNRAYWGIFFFCLSLFLHRLGISVHVLATQSSYLTPPVLVCVCVCMCAHSRAFTHTQADTWYVEPFTFCSVAILCRKMLHIAHVL
jgi:hypothetical protein